MLNFATDSVLPRFVNLMNVFSLPWVNSELLLSFFLLATKLDKTIETILTTLVFAFLVLLRG